MSRSPAATAPGPRRTITPEPVGAADSAALLHAYYTDIVDRYHRTHGNRPATAAEVAAALAAEPSGDLAPPGGLFLVARLDGRAAGCAGLRRLDPETAELTRVFVTAAARRAGLGGALLRAAEEAAAALGAGRVRLDTRADLTEARAMYRRYGYREIPAFHRRPYADHFFEKAVTP